MKKTILIGLALSLSMTTVAFAAPLNNYDSGKTAVEVGMNVAPALTLKDGDIKAKDDVKKEIYGGVTVGLGSKLAIQYDYRNNKLEATGGNIDYRTQQYNLRYKLNNNSSAYIGQLHSRLEIINKEATASRVVAGFTSQKSLGQDITGWVGAGFGSGVQQYEAGVGFALSKNTDFDISYRYLKMNDITDSLEATSKGLYTGITFKF